MKLLRIKMSAKKVQNLSFKVIVTGPKHSGKSFIIQRLIQKDEFSTATTDDILRHAKESKSLDVPITLEGQTISLQIWDDVEPKISISTMHAEILGAIFVFDASDCACLDDLSEFVSTKKKTFQRYKVDLQESVFFLAFTKADTVVESERQDFKRALDKKNLALTFMTTYFVDAVSGEGVESMFEELARNLLRPPNRAAGYRRNSSDQSVIHLEEFPPDPKKQGRCCG